MSNPGVITLSELSLKSGGSFRVEDNLCESIHFHYKDIRIDLTIKELIEISKNCEKSVYDLIPCKTFSLEKYPCNFLEQYAHTFTELIKIKEENTLISDMKVLLRTKFGLTYYKRLNKQIANKLISNVSDEEEKTVVIFNGKKIVVSGAILLAQKYLENPKMTISLQNFVFENNKYSLPNYPIMSFVFKWDKKRIKNILKRIARKIF